MHHRTEDASPSHAGPSQLQSLAQHVGELASLVEQLGAKEGEPVTSIHAVEQHLHRQEVQVGRGMTACHVNYAVCKTRSPETGRSCHPPPSACVLPAGNYVLQPAPLCINLLAP